MKPSKLYDFLNELGVLDTGTPADIERARRNYWRQYKSNWRKQKRAETKSITVSYSMSQFATIARSAKKQKMTVTKFVQTASVVFGQQHTMPVDEMTFGYIREVLLQNYHQLRDLEEETNIPLDIAQQLIQKLSNIETEILGKLQNPLLLEEAIQLAIANDPEYINTVQNILKNT